MNPQEIESLIKSYPDFPKPGIIFKDISLVLANPVAFKSTIDLMADLVQELDFSQIVCIDARGFIFGSALAYKLNKGIILSRKASKLPGELLSESYDYEYSSATLTIQKENIKPGNRYLIVDDVLATGSTMSAVAKIITKAGGGIGGLLFFMEIGFLKGKELINKNCAVETNNIKSLLTV